MTCSIPSHFSCLLYLLSPPNFSFSHFPLWVINILWIPAHSPKCKTVVQASFSYPMKSEDPPNTITSVTVGPTLMAVEECPWRDCRVFFSWREETISVVFTGNVYSYTVPTACDMYMYTHAYNITSALYKYMMVEHFQVTLQGLKLLQLFLRVAECGQWPGDHVLWHAPQKGGI